MKPDALTTTFGNPIADNPTSLTQHWPKLHLDLGAAIAAGLRLGQGRGL